MLSHPNIVQVYDVSSTDNANFIVMELIDGISLKQYMEKKGVLNWKETLHFAMLIAKGLEHAHSRGIVHRDIKPHNVMVLKNGSVKVMDFGIARVMSKTNTLTKEALGSVHYISPEQAKGGWVDNRSDLYSLSVVMYEMMAGRPPYDGESPVAVAIQHINGGAPLPSTLNPNIPAGLEQIIMKGMALDVKDRYPSATDMLKDMEEFRKNPAILFAFAKPSGVSDATQPINLGKLHQQGTTRRTTAEKVAQRGGEAPRVRSGDSGRIRTSSNSGRVTGAAAAAAAGAAGRRSASGSVRRDTGKTTGQTKRSRRETEAAEKRSRMTTVAIVTCSVVAVIAIVVFLVALMSGAFFNKESALVEVPDLVGDIYYSGMTIDGFVIDAEHVYNNEFGRGQIFDQSLDPGNKVQRGTTIHLKVSLGEEPLVKIMEDLRGQLAEDAKAFLVGQGMNPLVKDGGFSDDYDEGKVISTDPGMGTELVDGQTVIIYISRGPMIEMGKMPNVVGMNYATAYKHLTDLGFTTVEPKYVDNDADKDEVVYQSVARNTEVDLTTRIVLSVSRGPEETEETEKPTEEPTEATTEPTEGTAEPIETTKTVRIMLPDHDEPYILGVYQNGQAVRESEQITPGTTYLEITLTGSGLQTYDVYVDGQKYQTIEVDFDK